MQASPVLVLQKGLPLGIPTYTRFPVLIVFKSDARREGWGDFNGGTEWGFNFRGEPFSFVLKRSQLYHEAEHKAHILEPCLPQHHVSENFF
jgi:hypothetical protein